MFCVRDRCQTTRIEKISSKSLLPRFDFGSKLNMKYTVKLLQSISFLSDRRFLSFDHLHISRVAKG